MQQATDVSAELAACIQTCFHCFQTCQQTALMYCLEQENEQVQPVHFRMMVDCAEACRAAAALMMNNSKYYSFGCRLCAEACRACATSCRTIGGMEYCVAACERCADACDEIAAEADPSRAFAAHARVAVYAQH